jgi:diacylglycerol kinase
MVSDIYKVIKAFGYAFNGWKRGLKERNVKIHLGFTIGVLYASFLFRISKIELLIVILLIGAVISAELINTAIEEICNIVRDKLKLGYSDTTAARDLAAGAVLVVAVAAAIIGLIIFVPKVLLWFW